MILWWGYRGIPSAQMNSMVPGTHLGVLVCPKTFLFNHFVGISSFPGKLQVAPVACLCIFLLSLVGPLAAYFPLVATLPGSGSESVRQLRSSKNESAVAEKGASKGSAAPAHQIKQKR